MENVTEKARVDLQCVQLIGELSHWGKHIHIKGLGVTICGCFTNDYDKSRFPNMPKGLTSKYKVVEWDITCEKCIEMANIMDEASKAQKEKRKHWN